MLALLKPRYVVPVHGEYHMLNEHTKLATSMGVAPENAVVAQDGDVIEASYQGGLHIVDHIPTGNVYVDGLGVGDVGQVVLRDRQVLSQDGILVVVVTVDAETGELVSGSDIISRGVVYQRESEPLMDAARAQVDRALRTLNQRRGHTAD